MKTIANKPGMLSLQAVIAGAVAAVTLLLLGSFAVAQNVNGIINDNWPSNDFVLSGASLLPAGQPSAEVAALIDQLAVGSIAARDAATNTLVSMDNSLAPQLRGALNGNLSADAANRVRWVITKMDQRSNIEPSVVTIHAANQPLQDVLQDLARQISSDIVIAPAIMNQVQTATVSIDLDRGSCWDAIRLIEKAASVRTTINFNQLILNPPYPINPKRPLVDVPGITAGVFRIKPYHTTLAREIDYNSDRKPGSIVLQLSATCEPKTSLFDDVATCSAIDLIDENGHAFRPSGPIPPLVGLSSRGTVAIGIGFPETATMGTHLKSLKGTLTADVQTASKFIEFADLTNVGQSFDIGNGASLQLTSVTVDSEYTSIEIGLTATADLPPQVRRIMNDPGHALELFDSEGRRLFTVSVERKPRGQPNSPVWSIRIRRSTGDPKIVKVEIATASRQVSVPFELDDVSLPVPVAK